MALIRVTNVRVQNSNPCQFQDPFRFEITFDCLPPGIKEALEWKLVYVGSAKEDKYDQELDAILVGPVQVGKNQFVFEAPAPDITKLPKRNVLEVTVVLLTCSYRDREFIRIGYFVMNDYPEGAEPANLESELDPARLQRNILADKPRVTRFRIPWDDENELQQELAFEQRPPAPAAGGAEAKADGGDGGGDGDDGMDVGEEIDIGDDDAEDEGDEGDADEEMEDAEFVEHDLGSDDDDGDSGGGASAAPRDDEKQP